MSYHVYLFDPSVKTTVLAGKALDEFEHRELSDDQISYFRKRIAAYDFEEAEANEQIAVFEKKIGGCPVSVSIWPSEICFSVPYWDNNEEALFEAGMTAAEINDEGRFAVFNPQAGTWDDE